MYESLKTMIYVEKKSRVVSLHFPIAQRYGVRLDAHHADFRGHQVAESVEPLHVGFQVAGLLVVTEAALRQRQQTFN